MFIIFGKHQCPYCQKSIEKLNTLQNKYIFLDIEKSDNKEYLNQLKSYGFIPDDFVTVPVVIKYRDSNHSDFIGGSEELFSYLLNK